MGGSVFSLLTFYTIGLFCLKYKEIKKNLQPVFFVFSFCPPDIRHASRLPREMHSLFHWGAFVIFFLVLGGPISFIRGFSSHFEFPET